MLVEHTPLLASAQINRIIGITISAPLPLAEVQHRCIPGIVFDNCYNTLPRKAGKKKKHEG